MKNSFIFFFALLLGLTACSNSPTATQIPPTAVVVEVTRIVQITTTPIPSQTATPTPTLGRIEASNTNVAEYVGTPVVADFECYTTAMTQVEMNGCAAGRRNDMEKRIAEVIEVIKKRNLYNETELPRFLQLQAEWQDLAERECVLRSGYEVDPDGGQYKGGSMAPLSYGECLVQKYEDRLRELQILLIPNG